MKTYTCHKRVQAAKITEIESPLAVDMNTYRIGFDGGSVDVGIEYMRKHNPKVGGYFVQYEDGYQSFSPADPFEAGYTLES